MSQRKMKQAQRTGLRGEFWRVARQGLAERWPLSRLMPDGSEGVSSVGVWEKGLQAGKAAAKQRPCGSERARTGWLEQRVNRAASREKNGDAGFVDVTTLAFAPGAL